MAVPPIFAVRCTHSKTRFLASAIGHIYILYSILSHQKNVLLHFVTVNYKAYFQTFFPREEMTVISASDTYVLQAVELFISSRSRQLPTSY